MQNKKIREKKIFDRVSFFDRFWDQKNSFLQVKFQTGHKPFMKVRSAIIFCLINIVSNKGIDEITPDEAKFVHVRNF